MPASERTRIFIRARQFQTGRTNAKLLRAVERSEKYGSGNGRQGGGGWRTPLKKRSVARIKDLKRWAPAWSGESNSNSSSHSLNSNVDADNPGASQHDDFARFRNHDRAPI